MPVYVSWLQLWCLVLRWLSASHLTFLYNFGLSLFPSKRRGKNKQRDLNPFWRKCHPNNKILFEIELLQLLKSISFWYSHGESKNHLRLPEGSQLLCSKTTWTIALKNILIHKPFSWDRNTSNCQNFNQEKKKPQKPHPQKDLSMN